jgi:release factor glutamine methyltransferase
MSIHTKTSSSIRDLLSLARASRTSLEGQVLLAQLLGRPRSWVLAHPEVEVTPEQAHSFENDLSKLQLGAALPHLLGWWEFYGRRFRITPSVLIPRPETELMVETALQRMQDGERALDIGTGSGCVAVTLSAERTGSMVLATDLSLAALSVARSNAVLHSVQDRVHFLAADLLRGLRGRFDVICANLPYISSVELGALDVAKREPELALDGGHDGLVLIRRALADLPGRLRASGTALFEIDPRQADRVVEAAASRFRMSSIDIAPDLSGKPRLLIIQNG